MLPSTWSEGEIVVRAVEVAQTPALHAAFLECVDVVGLDPTFAEVPESTVGELVEQSVADESQERGFRMRSIHVGPTEELAGYFHLMEDVPNVGDAWLSILSIRPRFRRSGVGTILIGNVMCDFYHCTSPSKSSGFRLRRILSHTQIEWVSILVVHRLCKCHASRTFMVCTWKRCTNWA